MNTIRLTDADLMPDADVDALPGTYLYRPHYDRVIRDSTTVLKPDGSPLLVYAQDVLPQALCRAVFNSFKGVRIHLTDNRGFAAGGQSFRRERADGSLSRTVRWRRMRSDVLGFLDRDSRNPYCRMTTFARDNFAVFKAAQPLVTAVDAIFREFAPERWQAQRQFVDTLAPAFVIPATVFTSVTVNRSERTACHTDDHDYRPGLGVMSVLEGGQFYGGELIFPKYRTAVDMRTGGVCLADVHEQHGNAPLLGHRFVRLSFVFYAREQMDVCGTVEEERRRAARLAEVGQ
jgi:Oxygenase domain of the 2OGFeDO superfamily